MLPDKNLHRTMDATRNSGDTASKALTQRLLRTSHIFASAVREVLEQSQLQKVSPLPLSPSQLYLLKVMSRNGQHQIGAAAEFLGVSPSAATKTIDKLEGMGLVSRTPSSGDRRATLLTVSRKGRRLVRKFEKLVAHPLQAATARFAPEEIEHLAQLLERFCISLFEVERGDPGKCMRCAAYIEADCPLGEVNDGCPYLRVRDEHLARCNRDKSP